MELTCVRCSNKFSRNTSKAKFCDIQCCWAWRRENKDKLKGTFGAGFVPWNSGTKGKGVMKANSGSFQPGRANENKKPIGAVRLRSDKADGRRAWIKVTDNGDPYDWKLRAVYVWEKHNGPVPPGHVVHHKDRNKLNDSIENLELQTRAEHLMEHRHEYDDRRRDAAAEAARRRHARNRALRAAAERATGTPPDALPTP